MQQSYKKSRKFDNWKIPDYNYIKNIDIPICNNHNKKILICELT